MTGSGTDDQRALPSLMLDFRSTGPAMSVANPATLPVFGSNWRIYVRCCAVGIRATDDPAVPLIRHGAGCAQLQAGKCLAPESA